MAQRRLSRQPRIVPRLDAGNPLARNAAFVYVPSINRAIVNGITGALSGSTPPVRTATTNGIGTKHTAGAATVSYVSLGVPAGPTIDIATGPCTFVGVFYANSTTGVAIAERNDNNVTEGWVFGYTSGTAEGAVGLGFIKTYSIANVRKAITNTVVPGLNVLVVTFDGGALAAGCNIYLNGVLGTVSGSADSTGTTSTDAANTLYVGRNTFDTSASHDGTILLAGAFRRLWTAAEVLSFSRNPWQIFKNSSRVLAVAAAVSATTATAAAGAATVSAVGSSLAKATATSANGAATVSGVGATAATYLPTVSAAPYMAYGTRKLLSGYSGPALNHRSAGGTATDVSFSGQDMSFGALGVGTVPIWYDQSGNAKNLVQATVAAQPDIDPTVVYAGIVPICITNRTGAHVLDATGLSFASQNFTQFDVLIPLHSYSTTMYSVLYDTPVTVGVNRLKQNISSGVGLEGWGSGSMPRAQPSIFAIRSNATNLKLWLREQTFTKAANSNVTCGEFHFGSSESYLGYTSRLASIIYPAALSDSDVQLVIDALATIFSIPQTFDRRVVGDGDSIWAGASEGYNQNTQQQIPFTSGTEVFNIAVGGQTLSTCYANRATVRDILYTGTYGAGKCIFVCQAGSNDLAASVSASTLYTSYATPYISSAFALGSGASVVFGNVIARNFSGPQETERQAYNTSVVSNAAGATGTANVGADSIMGDPAQISNSTYYVGDFIHPTRAGAAILAPYYTTPINAIGASGSGTATAAAGVATVSAVGASTAATTATSANGVATVSAVGAGSTAATATAAAGVATVSGTAASSAASAGTAAGFATVSGVGASGAATGATAATGVATVSGAGASSAVTTPTAAAGVATVSGGGGALIPSTATAAAGIATVSAVAQASTAASASAAAGVATVSGVGSANGAGTATAAAGIATVSGIASSGGASAATPAAGVATVSGSGASSATATATAAAGSATVSAVATGIIPTTATPADGTATVSGVGSTSAAGQATATPSSGTSTVSAVGSSTAQTDATAAAGSATASAVGSASASMTATPAAGLATVSATAASNAAAEAISADGVATVSGVGSSTASGEADAVPAAGTSIVSGVGASSATTDAVPAAGVATVSATTPISGELAAIASAVWGYVMSNGKTAEQNVVEIREALDGLGLGIWGLPIEGTYTAADLLRVIAAVQAGKTTITSSVPGTATVEFRAIDDSVTRVSADMVGSERIDVEINAAD